MKLLMLALFLLSPTGALAAECPAPEPYAQDHIIVQGELPPGMEKKDDFGPPGLLKMRVKVPLGLTVSEAVAQAKRHPRIVYAEPDYTYSIAYVPEDSFVSLPWVYHHGVIQTYEAWDITTGSPAVLIGIVDTGLDPLNWDIAAYDNVVGVTIPKWVEGWDSFQGIPGGYETHYHGNHVGGIAAGALDNHHATAGICGGCSLTSYKFLNACASGYSSDAADAIYRAIDAGVDVMNHSWGGSSFSQTVSDAFDAACNADILMVVAAGNNGRDSDVTPFYPGSLPQDCIVNVAATTEVETLASYSNFGPVGVDLAAPGDRIYSLPPTSTGSQSQKPTILTASVLSGTSMAAPMVTGVAGLMLSVNPDLTALELKQLILESVDVIPAAAQTVTGGRLNALKSVQAAQAFGLPACGNGVCEAGEDVLCPTNP